MRNLYVFLIVSYSKPAEQITPYVKSHADWVKKYIDKELFLFAGPKKSKRGGAILAKSIDRTA